MGTFDKLRNNSKPVIWFIIIGVIIGFVGAGLFTVIGNNKLTLFGIADPESSSLHIDGQAIKHVQNNNSEFDYMNTFLGVYSPSAPSFITPSSAYSRHIQTADEIKGKILTASMYDNLFSPQLSDRDILLFLIDELKIAKPSPIYSFPSIRRIDASFSSTHFIGFNENFTDEKNGVWDLGEDFIDLNNNRQYDLGENFTDGNGVWDEGEDFIDNPNGIWDEGEKFTDINENNQWDEGESFIDSIGNNKWDNGRDEWLSYCLNNGEIDYSLMYHSNTANAVKRYIDKVAAYDIKNKKYESLFKQFESSSNNDIQEDYLSNNSTATISYISYDLNNIDEKALDINEEVITQEIPEFEQIKNLGAISTSFLVIVLILLLLFSIINRNNRGKMSFGIVFSSLLAIIIIFKAINNSTQGEDEYREISYLYVLIPNDERHENLLNGQWDPGTDYDCGLDDICPNDSNYENPDENGTENDQLLESEEFTDLNLNGEYDKGEEFVDENGNNQWDYKERYADIANDLYDEGEDFIDCGFNNQNEYICSKVCSATLDNGEFTDCTENEDWDSSFGNGQWDNGENTATLTKDNMINTIKTSNFKDLYKKEVGENKNNGKLNGSRIVLSKQFNQQNRENLRHHSLIILDVINTSFKTPVGEHFIISDKDNQDNLKGYFIGYVDSKGNYYEKTQYDKIKAKHIKEHREHFIIKNDILNPVDFTDNVSEIEFLGESATSSIKSNYEKNQIFFRNNIEFTNLLNAPVDEIITLSEMQHGIITGTLLEMEPGETSDILFTDNNAYVIFMHEKEIADLSKINYDTEKTPAPLYTFSDIFNDKKNLMSVIDWRGEASFDVAVDPTQPAAGTQNNKDIYFDFNMFKNTFGIQ